MAYIVAEPCIKCKYMDCVEICPVLCFHEGENFLVINPDDCIDCGACVDMCPAEAIFSEEALPEKWREYALINRKMSATWPVIEVKGTPPADADAYKDVADKRDLLSTEPGKGAP